MSGQPNTQRIKIALKPLLRDAPLSKSTDKSLALAHCRAFWGPERATRVSFSCPVLNTGGMRGSCPARAYIPLCARLTTSRRKGISSLYSPH